MHVVYVSPVELIGARAARHSADAPLKLRENYATAVVSATEKPPLAARRY
jgi:hypothetical protein